MGSRSPNRSFMAARVKVTGDPSSGAFYGWRLSGLVKRQRRLMISLPARSPTGPVWTRRRADQDWERPRQFHRGREIVLVAPAGTRTLAWGPTVDDLNGRPVAFRFPGRGPVARRVVIIAGQHPGEDPAIGLALDIAKQAAASRNFDAEVHVFAAVNIGGGRRGHSRETETGSDLNRCWHLPSADPQLAAIKTLLLEADFVLDIHGDECASQPYLVGPTPCPERCAGAVATFATSVERSIPTLGRRPRPPGDGEDDPGILVNWLARQGVAGVMLELPMRFTGTGGVGYLRQRDRLRRQRHLADALLRCLGYCVLSLDRREKAE